MGICGTFMSGLAVIAKQQGHHVTGSDEAVYPPMSTQLIAQGIQLQEGYDPKHLNPIPDCVVIGNAIKRGNPMVEYILAEGIPYTSGPQWLADYVLHQRWVLAVSGTHGKTTTATMLAWILEFAGLNPGYLIGGVPLNFPASARYTKSQYFVMEADEYDSAFFDKRSKFLHFRPRTLVINCLEFDHADIFNDLDDIKKQFHYLLRTVPGNGLVIIPENDANVRDVVRQGCWSPLESFASNLSPWQAHLLNHEASEFEVFYNGKLMGSVSWSLLGEHNVNNALAAIAAAHHAGVSAEIATKALSSFQGVKRRLELCGQVKGISVYDDFAHHPTAITATLSALRAKVGRARIIAVMEFASYTMKTGVHREQLPESLSHANYVIFKRPQLDWNIYELTHELSMPANVYDTTQEIIDDIVKHAQVGDHIVVMSNRGFDGIHQKLLTALKEAEIADHGSPIWG
jgi:UDP-N-acetylmuramate: L-alanyl-gamma-D-glutamyl-meso-diaminopimelate ligase